MCFGLTIPTLALVTIEDKEVNLEEYLEID